MRHPGQAPLAIGERKLVVLISAFVTELRRWKEPDGFVVDHCRLSANPGVNGVYLGRPWRLYARTIFLDCWMGEHIRPEGWNNWNKPETEKGLILCGVRIGGAWRREGQARAVGAFADCSRRGEDPRRRGEAGALAEVRHWPVNLSDLRLPDLVSALPAIRGFWKVDVV